MRGRRTNNPPCQCRVRLYVTANTGSARAIGPQFYEIRFGLTRPRIQPSYNYRSVRVESCPCTVTAFAGLSPIRALPASSCEQPYYNSANMSFVILGHYFAPMWPRFLHLNSHLISIL